MPEPEKPERTFLRRWRFSLAGMFGAVLLLAALFGLTRFLVYNRTMTAPVVTLAVIIALLISPYLVRRLRLAGQRFLVGCLLLPAVFGLLGYGYVRLVANLSAMVRTASPAELREMRAVGRKSKVWAFKSDLEMLARSYPELEGVEQATYDEHGFSFVNENVSPPFSISVRVVDTWAGEPFNAPARDFQPLPAAGLATSLQLECAGNPPLTNRILVCYEGLQELLSSEMDWIHRKAHPEPTLYPR